MRPSTSSSAAVPQPGRPVRPRGSVRRPGLRALLAICLLGASCSRTQVVTEGPIHLGADAQEVPFSHPVTAYGPELHLCLEFGRPGDSRAAGAVHAVLITVEGRHDTLQARSVDRRGEALVCLEDRVAGVTGAGAAPGSPARYRAALLRSEVPVQVRALRWYGGEAPAAH